MFRVAQEGERGVVVKKQWVFTGDRILFDWKSIHAIDPVDLRVQSAKSTVLDIGHTIDPRVQSAEGMVLDIGYAKHPKTGKLESGFVLGRQGVRPEGFAESMIGEMEFKTSHALHVRDRRFRSDFTFKPVSGTGPLVSVLPEDHPVRQRYV